MSDKVSRLDYCQYLLVSQINYTLTNFADHCERLSHDAVNRYLRGERIMPRLVWDNVRAQVVETERGYLVFDDTVLDWLRIPQKRHKRRAASAGRSSSCTARGSS